MDTGIQTWRHFALKPDPILKIVGFFYQSKDSYVSRDHNNIGYLEYDQCSSSSDYRYNAITRKKRPLQLGLRSVLKVIKCGS